MCKSSALVMICQILFNLKSCFDTILEKSTIGLGQHLHFATRYDTFEKVLVIVIISPSVENNNVEQRQGSRGQHWDQIWSTDTALTPSATEGSQNL